MLRMCQATVARLTPISAAAVFRLWPSTSRPSSRASCGVSLRSDFSGGRKSRNSSMTRRATGGDMGAPPATASCKLSNSRAGAVAFQQVAAGARAQRLEDALVILVHREHERGQAGIALLQEPDAFGARHARQSDIGQQ